MTRPDSRGLSVSVPSPPTVVVDGQSLPILIVRHRRARRYLVRVVDEGRIRLTVPLRASVRAGVRFALSQTDWIVREWRRVRSRHAWIDGTPVWFRGDRAVVRLRDDGLYVGDWRVAPAAWGSGSGTAESVRIVIHREMRRLAAAELVPRGHQLARAAGFVPTRVVVRDQRTRWGSCSSRGVVSLNWRLIQMPPPVADYVVLHELVHLAHPNHSARFWRAVDAVCPDWRSGEAWLRRFGRDLL